MAEIASAYVSLIPSAQGFGTATAAQIGPQMGAAGKAGGGILGKAMLAGFAVVGVAAGVGKALYEIGSTFDDVSDTIRVGTGATGSALAGLEESAQRIGKNVPSSFADIGTAVADINTRLGLTGKPLEQMTSQMLNLSRITGTDVSTNVASLTRVFGDWGISMKDQPAALDAIFYASQATGAGIDTLAESVVRMGAPLRQFGFSFEESLAMFGKWEKEGVNTTAVMSGLKIGLGKFSKAGLAPKQALADVQKAIMDAGSAGEANKIAIEAFGQRAGPDMAAAVREGRFALGDLVKGIKGSKGSIKSADKDTRDFAESWQIFKNRALVGLEPLATRVFTALGDGMARINSDVVPAVKAFIEQVRAGAGSGGRFATAFAVAKSVLSDVAGFIVEKVVPAVRDGLSKVIDGAKSAFDSIRDAVKDNEPQLRQLLEGFKRFANFVVTKVIPVLYDFYAGQLKRFGKAVGVAIRVIGFLVDVFNKVWPVVKRVAGAIADFVREAVDKFQSFRQRVSEVFDKVRSVISAAVDKIKAFKDGVESAAKGAKAAISRHIGTALGPIKNLINALQTAINKFNELRGKRTGGVKGTPVTGREAGRTGELFGRSFGEGVARGVEKGGKRTEEAVKRLLDKLKSKLDTLKSDFLSLKDSVAGAFTGNLFESETASGFISNLLDTKGQLQALKAAFTKLIGWGLKPEFLSQLFQSGNGGLILDLAAGTQDQATQANALFGDVTSLSNSLGANVADAKFGDKIDGVRQEIKELRKDLKNNAREIGQNVGREINGAARGGRRLARV